MPKSALQSRTSGSIARGTSNSRSRSSSQAPLCDVVEQGARGVGGVGGVHPAAGEAPEQEGVDGAEGELAGLGQRARALDVVEQPGDLGGREIGIEQQPGLGRDHRLVARLLQRAADVGRAPVLPDDGAVDGLARAPVPDEAGLALVGDADGGDVARPRARRRRAPAGRSPPWCARCPRGRARPSRRPGSAGRTRAGPGPGWPDPARTRWRGSRSCPGRARGSSPTCAMRSSSARAGRLGPSWP